MPANCTNLSKLVMESRSLIPSHMKRHAERKLRNKVGYFAISRRCINCHGYAASKEVREDNYEY